MLKKLFAHEWKDTWKLMAIINAAMFLIALSGMIFFNARNAEAFFSDTDRTQNVVVVIAYMSYLFLYVVGIAVLSFGPVLYFFIRFYRNLYTDQGYLMHTLPVSSHQLILSKTFVALIWRIISALVGLFSVMILFLGMLNQSVGDIFEDVFDNVTITGPEGILMILLILLGFIGSTIFQLFIGYLAISIGQQLAKNKVLASIGVYIGIQVALNIITNILTQTVVFSAAFGMGDGIFSHEPTVGVVLLGMLIMDIVIYAVCFGIYVLIHHFMTKKLNLD